MCAYLDRFVVAMIAPSVKASLHLADFQLGIILGPAFAVSYAVFGIPLGWIADHYSRRMVIFFGAIMFAVATALSGLAGSFTALLIGWIFVGIGESSLAPAALALISEKFPKERLTTAVSIFSMGPKFGSAAAFSLGAVAIAAATALTQAQESLQGIEPWRLVLAAAAVPSLIVGALVLTFSEPARGSTRSAQSMERTAIKFLFDEWRLMLPMLLGFSFILICGQSLISWVPSYIDRQFHLSPAIYGPILSVISMGGAFALVFKGMIMDWFFARGVKDIHLRFFSWILAGSYPLCVAVFLVNDATAFFALYSIIGVVTIASIAYASAAIQIVTPAKLRAQVFAICSIPLLIVGGLGPPIVGALTDYVFHDTTKLGWSLACVICTTVPACWMCLRLSLAGLRRAVEANET